MNLAHGGAVAEGGGAPRPFNAPGFAAGVAEELIAMGVRCVVAAGGAVDDEAARRWYMQEAADQNWSSRALERQMCTLYYERLLVSQDKAAVAEEARMNLARLDQSPRGTGLD